MRGKTGCQTRPRDFIRMQQTEAIDIVVNGEARRVPGGLSVKQLLELLDVVPDRVAVELNRQIVRRGEWHSATIQAGAQLEIVQFVGGG
ncbi:MAG TPA: sulfur carrier protein ThiS [Bryobacteraceae bacterium]|nr:sulfur carrier protein ThiS [Bryobacteraceae bacterium]